MLPHGTVPPTSRATEAPGEDTWPLVKINPGRSVSQEPTLMGKPDTSWGMPTGQNRQKPTLHGEAVTPGQGRKHYIWGTEQQHCNYGLANPRGAKPQHCSYGWPNTRGGEKTTTLQLWGPNTWGTKPQHCKYRLPNPRGTKPQLCSYGLPNTCGTKPQHCNYGLPNPRGAKLQHCNYGDPTPGEQNRNVATMDDPTPREQNHNIATMDDPTPGNKTTTLQLWITQHLGNRTATLQLGMTQHLWNRTAKLQEGGGMTPREPKRTNCCGLFLFQLPFTKCHHQTSTGYPIRKASPHSQCPPGQQVSCACSTQHSRAQVLQHQMSKAQSLISQML